MRARTMILFLVAILLAGGTAMLVRSWLMQQRTVEAEAAPVPPPPVQKSVLVARSAVPRGQILKPTDLDGRCGTTAASITPIFKRAPRRSRISPAWVQGDQFARG